MKYGIELNGRELKSTSGQIYCYKGSETLTRQNGGISSAFGGVVVHRTSWHGRVLKCLEIPDGGVVGINLLASLPQEETAYLIRGGESVNTHVFVTDFVNMKSDNYGMEVFDEKGKKIYTSKVEHLQILQWLAYGFDAPFSQRFEFRPNERLVLIEPTATPFRTKYIYQAHTSRAGNEKIGTKITQTTYLVFERKGSLVRAVPHTVQTVQENVHLAYTDKWQWESREFMPLNKAYCLLGKFALSNV